MTTSSRIIAASRTTVSSGWAEPGPCVKPVTADARLGFLPLQQEAYELCIAESLLEDPRVRALVAALPSSGYRRWLDEVPGGRAHDTGGLRTVA